jgi:DNA-binding transcriptional ArsR family regulator
MPANENICEYLLDIIQLLLNNYFMETKTATTIFEALTSEARLSIFRLLVKYSPGGLVAGEIARMLDIPKTNLSFHLKAIVHSGLASMERKGRNTRYKANIPLMMETIAYLTDECCSGNPDQCGRIRVESGVTPEFMPDCNCLSNESEKINE